MIEWFVTEWLALVAYCNDRAAFDQATFKTRSETYARRWSRLSMADQGEVCDRIRI